MVKLKDLYVVVGLGNPGRQYEDTRHNVGFVTVDLLAQKLGIKISKIRHKALIGEGIIDNKKIVLVKPQTFMNLSGESIRGIVNWYKVTLENLIVIYDDIDLSLGTVRIRQKGSSGTHNGMKSIIYQLQSDEFPRIRIGIDLPDERYDLARYVLGRFTKEEKDIVQKSLLWATDAVQAIVLKGINYAMNNYNKK